MINCGSIVVLQKLLHEEGILRFVNRIFHVFFHRLYRVVVLLKLHFTLLAHFQAFPLEKLVQHIKVDLANLIDQSVLHLKKCIFSHVMDI